MIRLIRNRKTNKVTSLLVNGKKYSVSKDLAHALGLEEQLNNQESEKMALKAKEVKKSLDKKKYLGESSSLKLSVQFDEMNRVKSNKTILEFQKDFDPHFKELFFEVIEDFILSLNRAHYKRHLDYSSSVQKIGFSINKKTA